MFDITAHIDGGLVITYIFWASFIALVYYLRREDKREGYPLVPDSGKGPRVEGVPAMPAPKTFTLPHGAGVRFAPRPEADESKVAAVPLSPAAGNPLIPTGNPMLDGVGPGAYALRPDEPDLTFEGNNKIVPLRVDNHFGISDKDPDPRGMDVIGCDGALGGTVKDVWVDRAEPQIRYLEVQTGKRRVLLPMNFCDVKANRGEIVVEAITGEQFGSVPTLKNPDRVTLLEEDRITAYYGGGTLYAVPGRTEPVIL